MGRVSQGVLLRLVARVELLDPCRHMLAEARARLPPGTVAAAHACGLQEFEFPARPAYDLVALQWCTLYLTDADFVRVLRGARGSLRPGGVIFLKENLGRGHFWVDRSDSSVARTDAHLKQLFGEAGLRVLREQRQPDWPADLLPVKMYALR